MAEWKNRIVGTGSVDPRILVANEKNWRTHPKAQRIALEGLLDQIGWIGQVLVNKTTGRLVDGHLRVEMALEKGEESVPVTYVELTEAEEEIALTSLDPIAGLAERDDAKIAELLKHIQENNDQINPNLTEFLSTEFGFGTNVNQLAQQLEEFENDTKIPAMELQVMEGYDYIVLVFRNQLDWISAVEKLGIGPAEVVLSDEVKKKGLGRAVDGAKAMKRMAGTE